MSVGFLEESAGVRSMTRLAIAWLLVLASLVVITACVYTFRATTVNSSVLLALGTILTALVLKGAVAIRSRNVESDTPTT